jgi:hypothetical protein
MADAQVPAPARTNTNPKKMRASAVDSVQGVRMWITHYFAQPKEKYPRLVKDLRQQAGFAPLWITMLGASPVASPAASHLRFLTAHTGLRPVLAVRPAKRRSATACEMTIGQSEISHHRSAAAGDSYSITSSASESSLSGISTPCAFAVLRLMTNSNLMD